MKVGKTLIISFVALMATAIVYVRYAPQEVAEHLHYHAGFRVYIDDQLQDYSDYKYMNYVACTEHDNKKSKEEEQIEKAHLHDSVGDIVHVHRGGAKWSDLFKNIGVVFDSDKDVRGYIEGEEIKDVLDQSITSYTTAIFIVGESSSSHSNEKIPLEYIKEVEAKSELCGT